MGHSFTIHPDREPWHRRFYRWCTWPFVKMISPGGPPPRPTYTILRTSRWVTVHQHPPAPSTRAHAAFTSTPPAPPPANPSIIRSHTHLVHGSVFMDSSTRLAPPATQGQHLQHLLDAGLRHQCSPRAASTVTPTLSWFLRRGLFRIIALSRPP